jgi:hypothetical protein
MSGGEKDYKELMNKFELVSNAFLNLDEGYLSLPSPFFLSETSESVN